MTITSTAITAQDVQDAQAVLDEIIQVAKQKGLSHTSSRSWARQLGVVATLRRQHAAQQKKAGQHPGGWGKA